jgi:hypothetical protein
MALPIVSTSVITSITTTTATGGGSATGTSITARGVVWNTSPTPTIANNKTTNGTGAGAFVSSLTGLEANNTYYVRAYATNSGGTAYGSQVSFSTVFLVESSQDDLDLWAKIGYIAGLTPTDESVARQLAYLKAETVIHEQP